MSTSCRHRYNLFLGDVLFNKALYYLCFLLFSYSTNLPEVTVLLVVCIFLLSFPFDDSSIPTLLITVKSGALMHVYLHCMRHNHICGRRLECGFQHRCSLTLSCFSRYSTSHPTNVSGYESQRSSCSPI